MVINFLTIEHNIVVINLNESFYFIIFILGQNSYYFFNPFALRMAKTSLSVGHFECNRVKSHENNLQSKINRFYSIWGQ